MAINLIMGRVYYQNKDRDREDEREREREREREKEKKKIVKQPIKRHKMGSYDVTKAVQNDEKTTLANSY